MNVIKHRKIFYAISAILLAISLFAIFRYGLRLGIDFKGGSIIEAEYAKTPEVEVIKENLEKLNLGEFSVRPTGERGVIVRIKELNQIEQGTVAAALAQGQEGTEIKRFDSVGPILGAELRKKAFGSIIAVLAAIILFITFAFRKVSKPVASWKYGVIAIIALLHDVIIPTGVFAFLGHFSGVELDALFVTALLVVLGFSIHDTIVVFDRTRENLRINEEKKLNKPFETIVGESVSQTFTRSINTSLTTIIALVVLYIIGPEATQNFVLALLIGMVAGT
ncbi:MAG TPA: protein translocase subunit SecF, partial [Candidatus Paceibacterota bacterium]|nr:protein translocase subunit SecF [Candidatus Paceibacterota bacterium]